MNQMIRFGIVVGVCLAAVSLLSGARGAGGAVDLALSPVHIESAQKSFSMSALDIMRPASGSDDALGDSPASGSTMRYSTGGRRTVAISRSAQYVWVYDEDGALLDQFQCATGIYYPLPGEYVVSTRKLSSVSPDDGSRFRYFTVFARSHRGVAIGFHSIPVDTSGNKVGGLGAPISHGCVRVEEEKAQFLYGWATPGSAVVVTR